jgi:alkylation response protein AidB-like acyl-CoA dehydrogenase
MKKWITNGIWADYCTAAVRTGVPGHRGVSVLVIPLDEKGVSRKRMHNTGVNASGENCYELCFHLVVTSNIRIGSTLLEFDNVRVPVENLIGKENEGFQIIMSSKPHYGSIASKT